MYRCEVRLWIVGTFTQVPIYSYIDCNKVFGQGKQKQLHLDHYTHAYMHAHMHAYAQSHKPPQPKATLSALHLFSFI